MDLNLAKLIYQKWKESIQVTEHKLMEALIRYLLKSFNPQYSVKILNLLFYRKSRGRQLFLFCRLRTVRSPTNTDK